MVDEEDEGAWSSEAVVGNNGPSRPFWEMHEVIDTLVLLGDEHERNLIKDIIRTNYGMHCEMDRLREYGWDEDIDDASGIVKLIRRFEGQFLTHVKNLIAHWSKVARVERLVVDGAAIGAKERVRSLRSWPRESAQSELGGRLHTTAGYLSELVDDWMARERGFERAQHDSYVSTASPRQRNRRPSDKMRQSYATLIANLEEAICDIRTVATKLEALKPTVEVVKERRVSPASGSRKPAARKPCGRKNGKSTGAFEDEDEGV